MNKMLNKIKKFFKENYIELLVLVLIVFLLTFKLDVSIYSPGGMINLSDRITSNDKIYNSKGSLNMTYVTMRKGSIPVYILAKILPTWDVVKNEDITYDGDIDETIRIDKLYLEESISNAYMVAYNTANVKYNIKNSNNYITYISDKSKTNLKIFDNIIKYDNIEFTTLSVMQDYIKQKKIGQKIIFDVKRNDKFIKCYAILVNIGDVPKIGIATAVVNEYSSKPKIDVKSKQSESGSSGGFMTTLAIYNSLTKNDITKGHIIAGTGTIDDEGNVDVIGGVKYKLSGAVKNHADVFLVPKDNYKEALEYKKKHNFDIKLKSISKFEDALKYLQNLEG